MKRDYIDALTHSEPEAQRDMERSVIGVPKSNSMVVPTRCVSSEEMEDREAIYFAMPELPLPFWDETGALEPFNTSDLAILASVGVSPEEMEIIILEEHMER